MKPLHAALALAIAISFSGCGAEEPDKLLASAKDYMEKQQFRASVIQLKNLLQQAPENAEARYLLGVAYLEQGDPTAAQIELDKAAQLGYDSGELQVAFARTALARGEADKMLAQFASKTLPDAKAQAELRALAGMAHLARNERNEAQRAFDQALALDPANVTANLGTARLAALAKNFAEGLSRVERALATAPRSADGLLLKADLLDAEGQYQAAENAYRSAVRAAPNPIAAQAGLIFHLVRQGALDKASAETAALEKAAPRDPRTFYARTVVLVAERNFPAAREAVQQVLKAAPEHVPSLTLAGLAALESGALQEAESHLRKAVYNAPQAVDARRLLAHTHLRMGKTQLALTEADELLKVSGDPRVLALAGEARLASGDVAGAARHYEQAKSLLPKNASVQTRLAQIRFAAGETKRAITELESASANDPDAYQADLALITNYLRQRQADEALQAIQVLEKKQPNNPLTHNLRGGALLLKNDASGARKSFERALELQPTYMPAVSNLAQLDLREKKPEAARRRYEAVLKKEPNNEQALIGLAVVRRLSGTNPEAVETLLKQSVSGNPASPGARTALINFYLRSQNFKAAVVAAQEAQAALPNHPAMVQALGMTQIAAGEPRQAIDSFMRLAELMPKSPEPQLSLARAHLAAKEPDDAIKSLRAALALRPELLPSVQRDIAAIYVSTGRHEEALREAKTLQGEHPKQPLGYVLEGEIYIAQKKGDLAEQAYRAALAKFDLPALLARTHAIMQAVGKRSQADLMAESWITRHPDDTTVLAYLGERDIREKNYERAASRYQAALERQPDNAAYLNNLAWLANELKRPEALKYAERAHDLAPENPAIMDTLGTIVAARGQTQRGLELLGRAAELAPDAYQIRLNFAKALLKADHKAAARRELETLAKLDSRLPVQQEAASMLAGL